MTPERSLRRVPELDGIRGIAIALVLVWHFVVCATAGAPTALAMWITRLGAFAWSGVDLFFVLSGYLITGILLDSSGSDRYFSSFYVRRCFRILPLYAVLISVFFAVRAFTPDAVAQTFDPPMPWWVYATFTTNFWVGHYQAWQFYGITWSVAVEEQFYWILPLIIAFTPRRALLSTFSVLIAATMVIRALLVHTGTITQTSAHVLFFTRADALLLGGLGAIMIRDHSHLLRRRLLTQLLAITTAAVAAYHIKGCVMMSLPLINGGYTVLALMYLSFLLLATTQPTSLAARFCRIGSLRRVGQMAYGLYLIHDPVQFGLHHLIRHQRPRHADLVDVAISALALALSVGLAAVSWRYFESKMIAIGHRITTRKLLAGRFFVPEVSYASAGKGS